MLLNRVASTAEDESPILVYNKLQSLRKLNVVFLERETGWKVKKFSYRRFDMVNDISSTLGNMKRSKF